MRHPVTDDFDRWTMFNLRHAHVSSEGIISWRTEPLISSREAEGNREAADLVVYPYAWVNCDECGRRLQFTVTPETKLPADPTPAMVRASRGHGRMSAHLLIPMYHGRGGVLRAFAAWKGARGFYGSASVEIANEFTAAYMSVPPPLSPGTYCRACAHPGPAYLDRMVPKRRDEDVPCCPNKSCGCTAHMVETFEVAK